MTNQNEEIYYIHWEGPYAPEQIESEKYGIYQIYGQHPVYGSNVLLYIGRTENSFASRLANRAVIWGNADAKNVQIYLGTVYRDTKRLENEEKIEAIKKIEPLLIYAHFPAANSSNIASLGKKWKEYKNIRVINTNYRRSLLPEVSGLAMVSGYMNYVLVDQLKEENPGAEFYIDKNNDDYSLCFGRDYNDFWIGVDGELWEKSGIPFAVGVWEANKEKLEELAKKVQQEIISMGEKGDEYYVLPVDVSHESAKMVIEEMKKLFNPS
jgi:hypothetical protein